jgi:4-amino-4-deoxy-L-arabinose transferase-like glycosyltransferase
MESQMNSTRRQQNVIWVGVAFILILGIFLHRFSTWNWGVGVSHDSIFYISSAENFLAGNGISRIGGGNAVKTLTHFPPLYPLSLSFLGSFIGVREATDWSAAILFGINAVLVVLIIFQASKSLLASLSGGLLVLISPLLLGIHFEAMSEPLYIALALTNFLLLASYFKNRKNWQLILAAVAASLAYLTRYIGVSVLLTGVLSLLLLYRGSYRTKLKKVALFGIIAFVPNLLWYVRNYLLTGSLTNRVLAFHPITKVKLNEGLLSLSEWIFSEHTSFGLGLGSVSFIFFIVIIGFILKFNDERRFRSNEDVFQENPLPILIVLHILVYIGLLFLSLTFFDISTGLNNRILLPLYVLFLILSVVGVQWVVGHSKGIIRKALYLANALLFTIVFLAYAGRSSELIEGMRREGSGFNSASWRNSEIIAILNRVDPGVIVYSNEAFPVYYLTGIGAYGIPEKYDPVKSEVRDDFQRNMEVMRERLRSPSSALVVFHQGNLRVGMPTLNEIVEGFVLAHESGDGVIFVDPDHLNDWDIR